MLLKQLTGHLWSILDHPFSVMHEAQTGPRPSVQHIGPPTRSGASGPTGARSYCAAYWTIYSVWCIRPNRTQAFCAAYWTTHSVWCIRPNRSQVLLCSILDHLLSLMHQAQTGARPSLQHIEPPTQSDASGPTGARPSVQHFGLPTQVWYIRPKQESGLPHSALDHPLKSDASGPNRSQDVFHPVIKSMA